MCANIFASHFKSRAFMDQQDLIPIDASNPCDPGASFSCLVSSGRKYKEITYVADIPPDTSRCNHNVERWKRNDSILSKYWSPEDGVRTRFSDSGTENIGNHDSQSHQLTYGEVTPLGVRQLAYEMGIAKCNDNSNAKNADDLNDENDSKIIFYDLGSGVGRLATQMYIDQPNRVAKAIGIELAEDRHTIGTIALEGIVAEEQDATEIFHTSHNEDEPTVPWSYMFPTEPFPVQFIYGDALEVDLDPATTHVYISSLCFPKNVLLALQKKLLGLPNIRVVAALNRLDLMHQLGGEHWEERSASIQMSWGDCMAKIYHKVS